MNRSDQINELATALAKAQLEMKAAPKTAVNPHFKSKYAALPDVIDVAKTLAKHGLSFVQPARVEADGAVTVETVLMHSSGQWLSESLSLRPQQNTPQGIGSALTYGRRYGLSSLVGIAADEDDDGNAASVNGNGKAAPAAHPSLSTEDVTRIQATNFEDFKSRLLAAKTKEDREKVYPEIRESHDKGAISDAQRKLLLAVANAAASGVTA